MAYAEKTSVPVDRSQAEIKKILQKYSASEFVFGESNHAAMVMFQMKGRRIKFLLPMPQQPKESWKKMSQQVLDQKVRTRWRALVLAIKAKLECVESGIATLEQEFMAHIVLPNGQTVGDLVIPEIESSYQSGNMPPLLGMRPDGKT